MSRPKINPNRRKMKTSITLDKELYNWVQSKIETKEFSSLTHAVERGLLELRNRLDKK